MTNSGLLLQPDVAFCSIEITAVKSTLVFVLFLLFARMKSVSFLATPPHPTRGLLLYPTGHPQEGMSQLLLKVSSCQKRLFPVTFACGKKHYINTIYLNFPLCLSQVAGEQKYHPECFTCLNCRTFIGDGDTYALVERSKLYWWGVRSDCQRLNLLLFAFNTFLTNKHQSCRWNENCYCRKTWICAT